MSDNTQFLNIMIVYRINDYKFLSECPEWILSDDKFKSFDYDKFVKVSYVFPALICICFLQI